MVFVSCAVCGKRIDEKDAVMTNLGGLCPDCVKGEEKELEKAPEFHPKDCDLELLGGVLLQPHILEAYLKFGIVIIHDVTWVGGGFAPYNNLAKAMKFFYDHGWEVTAMTSTMAPGLLREGLNMWVTMQKRQSDKGVEPPQTSTT